MDFENTKNLIAMQGQIINLLVKVKVMEDTLIEKGLLSLEDYNTKLSKITNDVIEQVQSKVKEAEANEEKQPSEDVIKLREKLSAIGVSAIKQELPENEKEDAVGKTA